MALEKRYPGARGAKVSSLVPECPDATWGDVTLEHAADMATGNYALNGYMADEDASHTNDLFLPTDHASKIEYFDGCVPLVTLSYWLVAWGFPILHSVISVFYDGSAARRSAPSCSL